MQHPKQHLHPPRTISMICPRPWDKSAGLPEDAAGPPEDAAGPPQKSAGPPEKSAGPPDDAAGPPQNSGRPSFLQNSSTFEKQRRPLGSLNGVGDLEKVSEVQEKSEAPGAGKTGIWVL